jgi:hypothetical protein
MREPLNKDWSNQEMRFIETKIVNIQLIKSRYVTLSVLHFKSKQENFNFELTRIIDTLFDTEENTFSVKIID